MKNICILGSGLVSSSVINFFYNDKAEEFRIVVGSKLHNELTSLQKKYPSIKTVGLDVTSKSDEGQLSEMIKDSDIVISLLTNEMHVPIAKKCISLGVNMVHASYCTNEMMELDEEARKNGVTILNEIGLDPGIDHFLAKRAIDEIHAESGSKVTAFISYCGGLPEPKVSSSNCLRYKFSWSPKTALGNLLNPAKYLERNEVFEIPAGGELINAITDMDFLTDLQLEGYPNRDSLIYKDLYAIREATDIIRGTLRYRGFGKVVKTLQKLQLLSSKPTEELYSENDNRSAPKSWSDLIFKILQNADMLETYYDKGEPITQLLVKCGFGLHEVNAMRDLGLLSQEPQLKLHEILIDTLADHLTTKLSFGENERDMVILRHEIRSQKANGDQEIREIEFIEYGEQDKGGFSVMSKTVGLSIGYATKLLLNGIISLSKKSH
ncbi:Alpha-aminoadipic semialdehyde synthase, mitochondrial [Orchesella cincta]|uniref:Alpha-aminoadipic semialdehyde synthase, mitochondrial n=1 Tax=Orchesella cincta TaxID=48709 RepID=A0A1D2NJG0_ORCCI|nr:Alpha-aminoadipic semialdehyde synthase, mitochondrial [Orchesella cincta]